MSRDSLLPLLLPETVLHSANLSQLLQKISLQSGDLSMSYADVDGWTDYINELKAWRVHFKAIRSMQTGISFKKINKNALEF